MNIELNGVLNPVQIHSEQRVVVGSNGETQVHQQVTCAAPLLARPIPAQTFHEIWLDANILSQAKSAVRNPNVDAVISRGLKEGMKISPALAMIEFFSTNDIATAIDIIFKRLPVFEQLYECNFDMSEIAHLIERIPGYLGEVKTYRDGLSDYMIVIENYFNLKDPWEVKCEKFARLMKEEDLPFFLITYLVGCLYFYIKDHREEWPKEVFGKIQSDMKLKKSAELARKAADNRASDVIYFTSSLLNPVTKDGVFHVAHVATSDLSLSFILKEICYIGIVFHKSLVTGLTACNGVPAYRPGGISDTQIAPVVKANIATYLSNGVENTSQLQNLSRVANKILQETYLPKA